MRIKTLIPAAAVCLICSCATDRPAATATSGIPEHAGTPREREIRGLIEQLVFDEEVDPNQPTYSPGVTDDSDAYREKFTRCSDAFNKLLTYKADSIPILAEHLDDKRQSINFRNHYLANSVGDACYWNIYYQLQDRPDNYSEYGYQREGKDGKPHVKPYWDGSPFREAGGLKQWLEKNRGLSYTEQQIKCLTWLLEEEKAIGACDAESYFINILPLEIRILERRVENGEDVREELEQARSVMRWKRKSAIPAELLPN